MTVAICDDDRFELIEEAKRRLLESTNIEDRPEEVAVLDSILFRFWQMGWLDQLREDKGAGTCKDLGGIGANGEQVFHCSECGCVLSLYDSEGANNLCTSFIYDYPRFCPECGRRIKEEAE